MNKIKITVMRKARYDDLTETDENRIRFIREQFDMTILLIEHDMKVDYKAVVKVSSDDEFRSANTSYLLGGDSVKHVYAKRLDVKVFWKFKGAEQSIAVSGVIK